MNEKNYLDYSHYLRHRCFARFHGWDKPVWWMGLWWLLQLGRVWPLRRLGHGSRHDGVGFRALRLDRHVLHGAHLARLSDTDRAGNRLAGACRKRQHIPAGRFPLLPELRQGGTGRLAKLSLLRDGAEEVTHFVNDGVRVVHSKPAFSHLKIVTEGLR